MLIKTSRVVAWTLFALLLISMLTFAASLAYATYVQVTRSLPAVVIVLPGTLPEIPGDVDGNGVVNIVDLTLVAASFNTSPPLNPLTDINKDGVVDIIDLSLVAINFGKNTN